MPQMKIAPSYAAKLFVSNTPLIQVYFEAVANALDAQASEISISIAIGDKNLSEDLEIEVADNGDGFTDERFHRFRELVEPADRDHKGLGRLVYLHHFSTVDIVSVYGSKKRTFTFSERWDESSVIEDVSSSEQARTVLRFRGFQKGRIRSKDDLTPAVLKEKLLEQFLPRFHDMKEKGSAFQIEIQCDTSTKRKQIQLLSDTRVLNLDDVPTLECKTFLDNTIHAYETISMYYKVWRRSGDRLELTAIGIDGRTFPWKLVNAATVPAEHSFIFLFKSTLFAGKSDNSRQRLLLPDDISEASLRRALRKEVAAILKAQLPEIDERNTKTKEHLKERYPHLTGLFDEDTVGLIDRDEAIDIAQRNFFKQQKVILECDALDDETFDKALEVSSRTLTEYILYRELIIKKFGAITEANVEEYGHDLIVPRHKRFDKTKMLDGIYSNNAWLLDDKFMTFQTILSEKRMDELIRSITVDNDVKDGRRPDISMIFSAEPEAGEKVEVVVVELKRRKANEEKSVFVNNQLLSRARQLINHCDNIQRMWYFGVVEIDPQLNQFLDDDGWSPLFSKGTVWFKERDLKREGRPPVPVPTYILSYDALIKDAAARNHTFLELLKNSFKKSTPS